MGEIILYFVELFNIKAESKYTIADMEKELSGVSNLDRLSSHAKDNMNNYDYRFMSGLQKFIMVVKSFKKIEFSEINKDRLFGAEERARIIVEKIKKIDQLVETNINARKGEWDKFKDDGELTFKKFERDALSKIGDPITVVRLRKSFSGRDPLFDKLVELFTEIISKDSALAIQNKNGAIPIQNTNKNTNSAISALTNKKRV